MESSFMILHRWETSLAMPLTTVISHQQELYHMVMMTAIHNVIIAST
jgi:hypothetical protein